MKAPKCRICGSSHWSHESHIYKTTDRTVIGEITPEMAKQMEKAGMFQDIKEVLIKKPFDRTAYQREYMREYRRRKRVQG